MLRNFYIYFLIGTFSALFMACNSADENKNELPNDKGFSDLKKDTGIKYAKRFAISENKNCTVLYLFGNSNIKDTTSVYIIPKDSSIKFNGIKKNTFILKSRCKKIASLSSIYTTMLCHLNEIKNIVAIDNIDYYNDLSVIDKYNKQQLTELYKNPEIDVEKTIVLNPDIIFTFGNNDYDKGPNEKIIRSKIPVTVIFDHLEETPIARAEWIKFFAAFVNKKQMADSIFNEIEKNYLALKNIAQSAKTKPFVFTEIKYGDVWYVAGGKSFIATYFNDANADYIWKKNLKPGSIPLGFEEVYSKAKDADFWLNLSLLNSKKELYSLDKRYAEFKAFKKGNLYNNNKYTNKKGYSIYWETGILFPDKVLSDLILIFHPELKSKIRNDFYYYKKLD